MAKEIELPDGSIGEFPDDMSDDAIRGVLRQKFSAPPAPEVKPQTAKQTLENTMGASDFTKAFASTPARMLKSGMQMVGAGDYVPDFVSNAAAEGDKSVAGRIAGDVAGTGGIRAGAGALASSLQRLNAARGIVPAAARTAEAATYGAGQGAITTPDDQANAAKWGAAGGAAAPVLGHSLAALGRGSQHILGMTTGAGRESVRQAFRDAPGFVENMRGSVEPGTVVAQARRGLDNMRQTMYDNYANAKGGWAADTTPMSLNPVEQAFSNVDRRFSFRGIPQPGVEGVRQQTRAVLDQWADNASRDPSFLTVEGLDALKRHLATITPGDVENRAGRAFVTELVDSVRQSIIAQRPEYRAAMQDYFNRSEQLDEIGRSLSLGNRATTDTALRKLQSVVRNNVNANFGQRLRSANDLAQQGGEDILPAISGQALNSATPRALQSMAASGAGVASFFNPALLATLPAFSPRAVGETARATGNIVRDPRTQAFIEAMRRGSGSGVRNMREPD